MAFFNIKKTNEEIKRDLKVSAYRTLQYKYGVITLLYVMQDNELAENYLECAIIKQAIEETNKEIDAALPTSLRGLDIKGFVHTQMAGIKDADFKEESFFVNLDHYIDEVKREISKLS